MPGPWSLVRAGKIASSVCSALLHCQKNHFVYDLIIECWIVDLAPVVQTLDSALHRINHYPSD